MPSFTPKKYQKSALQSMEQYFRKCQSMGNADYAFQEVTRELNGQKSDFTPLTGFDRAMPYFCLRIPTGGGKTYLASKAVALVNQHLLHTEHSVILWLVPSTAIKDQTLNALKTLDHPYHLALREAGQVSVMDLEGAKNLNRSTLETSTVVIVATRQAFQVEKEEIRKVYESSGALMPLFDSLTPLQKEGLLKDEDGNIQLSLANALRLRRPFVIVDEAHNSRTELAFDTLAKFNPSGIMELTATPDQTKTPSNVLHSVSAVELKAEEMIKLPIQLECVSDAEKCLAYAIDQRNQLDELAQEEQRRGAKYLRPLVLIQAEKKFKTKETRHTEWVKQQLIENHNIAEDEIVIATGSEKGLEGLDKEYEGGIFSRECSVKFIITQTALAEGWDCPYAYILVSIAELASSTAVEQLLGRVLRQPNAKCFETEELNRSYSYVVSKNFSATAASLRDRLVAGAGFEKKEANQFVAAKKQEQLRFDTSHPSVTIRPVEVKLHEELDLKALPTPLKKKVKLNKKTQVFTLNEPLTYEEEEELKGCVVMEDTKELISQANRTSQEAVKIFHYPAQLGEVIQVPQMMVLIDGELRLFDEPEALDYPWELPKGLAIPIEEDIRSIQQADIITEGGVIDVTQEGAINAKFGLKLERDLNLAYIPEHWNEAKLSAWFCYQIKDQAITHSSKRAFVSEWVSQIQGIGNIDVSKLNRHKFLIRTLIEKHVTRLRKEAIQTAYQDYMFTEGVEERVMVGGETGHKFTFDSISYAPIRDYGFKYSGYIFKKHFYERIGEFDSDEEFLCAQYIDQLAEKGKIKYWVRNLEGKRLGAFPLQMADSRFYPDFILVHNDGRILIVEYKGAHLWQESEGKRKIGNLWAEMSNGACQFVMIKDRNWHEIDFLI